MPSIPIRVLIVDDSAYVRKVLTEILHRSPMIEVVGTAWDGEEALNKVIELEPDVILVDLYMPALDGPGFIRKQMARRPLPVVIVSAADEDAEEAVAAMQAGAVEFVRKPTRKANEQVYRVADELIEKVLVAANIPSDKLTQDGQVVPAAGRVTAQPVQAPIPPLIVRPGGAGGHFDVLVIGVSTGGPKALRTILPRLPADFPVPIAIVLHMPEGYTGPFARRLDELSQIEVLEAEEGLEMMAGRAILAQAGRHLLLRRSSAGSVICRLDLEPGDLPHRPAVDMLFKSAAEVYGSHTLGVVMTGMGTDGASGAAWIKAQGGMIITEAEESCVVYGMPRSVVEAGLSDKIVLLNNMAQAIVETVYENSHHR